MRRAARIVGPLWPERYSYGPFSYATPVLAMVCFALVPDREPEEVQVSELLRALRRGPEDAWLGDRLSVALAALEAGGGDLGRLLARLRKKPEVFDYPDYLPSEFVPDFREPLAGVVEWTITALERSLAAEASASASGS